MKWNINQIIYFIYSIISFIFLALWSAEASFLPDLQSWSIISVFAVIFVALPLVLLFRQKKFFYQTAIKNKGLLYSQAACLFILEFIVFINQKDPFLNSSHSLEIFIWMLKLALFLSIIRVIRPLTFEEWSNK